MDLLSYYREDYYDRESYDADVHDREDNDLQDPPALQEGRKKILRGEFFLKIFFFLRGGS